MSRVQQQQQTTVGNPTSFCFKYCINLGDGKFGSMKITEKTNLYEQAENFCKIYNLQPYIAVILQNQIFQQILKIKEQITHKDIVKSGKSNNNNPHKSKPTKSHEKQPQLQREKYKHSADKTKPSDSSHLSSLHFNTSKLVTETDKKQGVPKHFENMFKRHEEIENRKEMSRKASFEKIPFRPVINSLSRKIVDLKRSAMSKPEQSHTYAHKATRLNPRLITEKSKEKGSKENNCPKTAIKASKSNKTKLG